MVREMWAVACGTGETFFDEQRIALQWIAQNVATVGVCVLYKVIEQRSAHQVYGTIPSSSVPTFGEYNATAETVESRRWIRAK